MSSDSEDDDSNNFPPGGLKRARLKGPTYYGHIGLAFSAESPVADWLLRRYLRNRQQLAPWLYTTHVCQNPWDSCISAPPSIIVDMMQRRRSTAVDAYMTCTGLQLDDEGIIQRSLDLLFLCPACINELVTFTAVNSESLYRLVHGGFEGPSYAHMFMEMFEVAVQNAPTGSDLPYSDGGLVDFPCVDLGLCRCTMRPLYVAIYFSNVRMMGVLLRYGADVKAEDSCRCDEIHGVHPLVRVYNSLARGDIGIPKRLTKDMPHSEDFVHCHQVAVLLVPTHNAELREACYAFARTFIPDHEFEDLVVEKFTLQHMCRMAVRSSLASSQAMPSGVEKLPLPKRLQDYILYKDKLAPP